MRFNYAIAEVCLGVYCSLFNSAREHFSEMPLYCCCSLVVLFYIQALHSWNKILEFSTCSACLQQDKLKRKRAGGKAGLVQAMEDSPQIPHFQPPRELVLQDPTRSSGALQTQWKSNCGTDMFLSPSHFLTSPNLGEIFKLKGLLVPEGSILPSCVMQPIATPAGAWTVAAWPERD